MLQKVSAIFFLNYLHGKWRCDLDELDNAVDYILFISVSYQELNFTAFRETQVFE